MQKSSVFLKNFDRKGRFPLLLAGTALLGSLNACRPSYTCACYNPGGLAETHILHGSHTEAQKACAQIDQEKQSIPMSETWCELK